jgi:signal transduction histidine kinase
MRFPANLKVRIVVDDDGPRLTPAKRERVARRGQRLDESKPGSGLGLSIVLELAARGLTLSNAPIGGAAELVLSPVKQVYPGR